MKLYTYAGARAAASYPLPCSRDPRAGRPCRPVPTERRLTGIMFTDIVGYAALMAKSEERELRAQRGGTKRSRCPLGALYAAPGYPVEVAAD